MSYAPSPSLRMVYPLLEIAHRTWLTRSGQLSLEERGGRNSTADGAIAGLLDRIARAAPEQRVTNSLLYWVLDLSYRVMLWGESIPAYAPEPYILRREGVAQRMVSELSCVGHMLQLLATCK